MISGVGLGGLKKEVGANMKNTMLKFSKKKNESIFT